MIVENSKIAKSIGLEMVVLDAGWFGNNSLDEHWEEIKGDWYKENNKRFPSGISALSETIREEGLKFGIWVEIEGLGSNSKLNENMSKCVARRKGKSLGYLCFSTQEVQDWAIQTMTKIIEEYGAVHWKLDFNLDPGFGCDDISHSHSENDSLFLHYEGLKNVVSTLKQKFTSLVVENCSSGGQRLNLAMAEYFDVSFLSDPDYSSHQMAVFLHSSLWLEPKQLLHFMWSNTVMTQGNSPFENLDLNQLENEDIRNHMRIAFPHQFGVSHRLVDYDQRVLSIMREEIHTYKTIIRDYLLESVYYPIILSDEVKCLCFEKDESSLLLLYMNKDCHIFIQNHELPEFSKVVILDGKENITVNELSFEVQNNKNDYCYILELYK